LGLRVARRRQPDPCPGVRVEGWLHTNGNLDVSHGTADLAGRLTVSGAVQRGENDPLAPMLPAPQKQLLGQREWVDSTDASPNNDGLRELIERADAGYPDPLDGVRFASTAAVRLLWTDEGLAVEAQTSQSGMGKGKGTGTGDAPAILECLTQGDTLPDATGAGSVQTTSIDVGALGELIGSNSVPGWNGILHLADERSGNRAFRLRNGAKLPPGGLVIATPNTLYIQGDYNAAPAPGGREPEPAAVVADSVVLLSPAWEDGRSDTGSSASSMTVRAGIVSGTPPEAASVTPSDLLRRVEDWSVSQMTLNGSLLGLYPASETGMTSGEQADAPQQFTILHDPEFLATPPGNPLVVVSLWKRPAGHEQINGDSGPVAAMPAKPGNGHP